MRGPGLRDHTAGGAGGHQASFSHWTPIGPGFSWDSDLKRMKLIGYDQRSGPAEPGEEPGEEPGRRCVVQ